MVVSFCFSLCIVSNASSLQENTDIKVEGAIDKDIYDMISAFENNTYVERNEDSTLMASEAFSTFGVGEEEDNTTYLYDTKQIGTNTFEATRVALYAASLEQSNQNELYGVVLFVSIVYNREYFNGIPCYMLTRVKGGVVQNGSNYWCEALAFRYIEYGKAYTSSGVAVGTKSNSCNYNGSLNFPTKGVTYYINGPADYYYDTSSFLSHITGAMRGKITFRGTSKQYDLEVKSYIGNP